MVGLCIAYYITHHPRYDRHSHSVTVLEASRVGGGASGKAGGLIATWADPACIAPLSFCLHSELAQKYDGARSWGFRNVHCADVDAMGEAVGHATTDDSKPHFHSHTVSKPLSSDYPPELDWIMPGKITTYTELGRPENTAQVHPHLFTNKIANLAEERGAKFILGSAMHVNYDDDGSAAESVTYKAKDTSEVHDIQASEVVIIRPIKPVSAYVLFPELHPKIPQQRIPPEIYSRPDGTIYLCGPSDTDVPLPETTDLVEFNPNICDIIYNDGSSISQAIREGEIVTKQACYRPCVVGRSRDIGPLVGPTGITSLWLASGHDSWGVSNAPGTGKVMSEMLLEGEASSADVSSLDPRLMLQKAAQQPHQRYHV